MKYLNLAAFAGVLYVNYLANAMPINGMNTGEVSALYPSLFTPAGLTFSIWGVIYLLLAGYVVYSLFNNYRNKTGIMPLFLLTCICNMSWIFAWHYLQTGLSVLIMLVFLVTLINIYPKLPGVNDGKAEFWLVRIPFSVYLGWISIATVANISAYLVDLGFTPDYAPIITALMIVILMIVVYLIQKKSRNWGFSATIIWALAGIIIARSNDGSGMLIIITAAISILFTLIVTARAPQVSRG